MLFHSDNKAGTLCRLYNRLLIQRLYAVHIHNSGRDPFLFKKLRRRLSRVHHLSAGNDNDIASVPQHGRLVHFKRTILLRVHILHRISPDTDVGTFFIPKKSLHQLPCLVAVARKIHSHVRDRRHRRNILRRMMAHSECSVADAAGDPDQLHVGVRISAVNLGLFIASGGYKAGRRCGVCFFAALGKSRCHTDQILLRNADFHGLIRICLEKRCQRRRAPGIAAQNHDVLVVFCVLHQNVTDYFSVGNRIHSSASFCCSRSL